jgi:MFS family permease
MKLPESLAVLGQRSFRIYWVGQAISLVGTWMQQMAQGWALTSRTSSVTALAAANLVATLPMLALGMKAGELADKHDKRVMLLVTQVAMMLSAFLFAALLYSNALVLWHIYALAFLYGVIAAFEFPVSQAFAPELVEPHLVPRAVVMMATIFHGGRLVGPALAGVLIESLGEGSAFVANGLSFLAVIASLVIIAPAYKASQPGRKGGSFREGIDYVRRDSVMRALIALLALTMCFVFPFLVVLSIWYARNVLGGDSGDVGSIMSASGLGSLLGAGLLLVATPASWRKRLWIGLTGVSLCLMALSFNRSLGLAVVLFGVNSVFTSMVMGTIMQTAQTRVPGELRGRVMALFGMAFTSVLPFSAMLLSALADVVGLTWMMGLSAGLYLLTGALLLAHMQDQAPPKGS